MKKLHVLPTIACILLSIACTSKNDGGPSTPPPPAVAPAGLNGGTQGPGSCQAVSNLPLDNSTCPAGLIADSTQESKDCGQSIASMSSPACQSDQNCMQTKYPNVKCTYNQGNTIEEICISSNNPNLCSNSNTPLPSPPNISGTSTGGLSNCQQVGGLPTDNSACPAGLTADFNQETSDCASSGDSTCQADVACMESKYPNVKCTISQKGGSVEICFSANQSLQCQSSN